ncbi:MAG: hypothetical protein Q8Q56_04880 [Alphaproteobacteria bacterium]|nr:hypothetical protein [Alphaproteobacteria bacterium]
MKKLLLLLSTVSAISAADVDGLTSEMGAMAIGYSSDVEYANHQKVHERFFRRATKNTTARAAIDKFAAELSASSELSRISLDGLSSRTRIMMLRELIMAAKGTRPSIPLSFHGTEFNLDLAPTPDQPGNGILRCIGSYAGDIFPVIESFKEKSQAKFARKLAKARKVAATHAAGHLDYHPAIPDPELTEGGKKVDLEMLNLLLDFEVARRLIGTEDEEKAAYAVAKKGATAIESPIKIKTPYANMMDSVPVASSIVGLLQLSQESKPDGTFETPLEKFFHAPNAGRGGFNYGDLNAFEGAALDGSRKEATKKIIRKLRGGDEAKRSTKEVVHQEYLTYYGGASESEESDYDDE